MILTAESQSQQSWRLKLATKYKIHRKDRGKVGGASWIANSKHDEVTGEAEIQIRGVLVLKVDFRSRGGILLYLVGIYHPPLGALSKEA